MRRQRVWLTSNPGLPGSGLGITHPTTQPRNNVQRSFTQFLLASLRLHPSDSSLQSSVKWDNDTSCNDVTSVMSSLSQNSSVMKSKAWCFMLLTMPDNPGMQPD